MIMISAEKYTSWMNTIRKISRKKTTISRHKKLFLTDYSQGSFLSVDVNDFMIVGPNDLGHKPSSIDYFTLYSGGYSGS